MRVNVAFGKTGLSLNLPDRYEYRILEARSAPALDDAPAAVAAALANPIGCPPLAEMARGKKTAAISVCDITRPAPNRVVLPPLLACLEASGIARSGITILIATGLHRPASEAEIVEIVGPSIAAEYRVVNHHARERAEHRYLGQTSSGTPVYIDERFMAADLRISLGFIEPHLMLGYSGGRKLVAPGLAAQETIKVLHSSKFMRDGLATEGSIEENPLHRELLEIAHMAGHSFIIDTALSRTPEGQPRPIAQIFAGEPVQAHRKGVEFVSKVLLELLPEPADAVITTAAGYPLDLTYYQAIKGVTAAAHAVKPGGRILLFGACEEGVGAPEFSDLALRHRSGSEFLGAIENVPVTVDQWQLEKLALAAEKAELFFCLPGVTEPHRSSLWGRSFSDPGTAIEALLSGLPEGANIAVIPEGPYVLARAASAKLA